MNNEYLKLNEARCKDCYACIRACPVKAIGFANSQANIIADECVLCGNCYVTCPQNAKRIREDVPTVRDAIRAGKRVIYDMFLKAREHLSASGALYIVIQTKQGADSALKFLRENYADADIIARGGGFKVIRALMSSACED